jgi:response regulator RpfG family c-di-GMP phosphodiesterase
MHPAVLLIDGDPDSLNIYSILLEHHGYRVLRAPSGEDGLRLATEQRPNLIILDPYTPFRGQAGVLDALLENVATAAIPLLVLTAVPGFLISPRYGLTPGQLLSKPMQPRLLLYEVERRLQLGPPSLTA